MRNPLYAGLAACLFVLLVVALPAQAQEETAGAVPQRGVGRPQDPHQWQFVFIPYLWAMGVDGDVTVRGLKKHVDADFSDIIQKDFDIGAQAHFAVRKDEWALFVDGTYVRVSPGAERAGVTVGLKQELALVEFGGFYRLQEWCPGVRGARRVSLEALAGGRWWYLSSDVTAVVDELVLTAGGRKDWIDPIVGLRTQLDLTDDVALLVRGDIGGFHVGSNLSWNVSALLGYQFYPGAALLAGYRFLYVDYDEGSGKNLFKLDVLFSGPEVGIAFFF